MIPDFPRDRREMIPHTSREVWMRRLAPPTGRSKRALVKIDAERTLPENPVTPDLPENAEK